MKRSFTHPDPLLFDHMHKVINIYLPSLWLVKGDPSLLFYLYIFCICICPRWQGGSLTLKGLFYRGWWWRWWWHSWWWGRLCRFLSTYIYSFVGLYLVCHVNMNIASPEASNILKFLDCKKIFVVLICYLRTVTACPMKMILMMMETVCLTETRMMWDQENNVLENVTFLSL